ncbi:hypothetical protein AWZ03_001337 [Drosophila navojoa]|uniref:Uncharacterized protein n=1 Tax=Drosophila navojoa TaxID=7232 RepID=A0A484BTB8_DRONA|nr:hypothetical protein AWZ03_001337 [Drosophila navojoa]
MLEANTTGEVDNTTAMELVDILLDFVDSTKEPQLKRLIQYVCGLLNTNSSENLHLASKLIRKLFAVVVPSTKDDQQVQTYNSQLVSDFLLCVQMWTSRFPEGGKFLLRQVCSRTANNEKSQELGQLFDDILHELGPKFIDSSKLYCRVKKLLESKNNEERNSGYLILNKLLDSTRSENLDLYSYISVMECIKIEQKSISLSLLKEKNIDVNWMRILYIRLLQTTNIPMRHVIIDFIMDHFTVAELFSANLLIEFLSATNHLELHNLEGNPIQETKMKKFVTENDNNKQFVKALAEVPWTGVPLHRWLSCLEPRKQPQIKNNLLLNLAAHVRKIDNTSLRNSAGDLLCDLFEVSIESLSLPQFIEFVKTLYRDNEDVYGLLTDILQILIDSSDDMKEDIVHLTKSTYEIFRDVHNDNNLWSSLKELVRKLDSVPTDLHGWWRLPAFFSTFSSKEAREFFRTRYDVNFDFIEECKDLNELQQHLIDKLKCQTSDEIYFVKQRSLQHFLDKNVHHWSQLGEFNLNPIHILETGSFYTLSHMACLLEKHDQKLPDESLIDFFLEQLNKYNRRLLNQWLTFFRVSNWSGTHRECISKQFIYLEYGRTH